jgi:hypothetical protein
MSPGIGARFRRSAPNILNLRCVAAIFWEARYALAAMSAGGTAANALSLRRPAIETVVLRHSSGWKFWVDKYFL